MRRNAISACKQNNLQTHIIQNLIFTHSWIFDGRFVLRNDGEYTQTTESELKSYFLIYLGINQLN